MSTVTVHGEQVPAVGYGTWQISGTPCEAMVLDALELGYRHLDTAQLYENEADVGRAIARSGLSRGDLFVTTKVWWSHLTPDRFAASVEESLRKLGLDRVDLLLIHWPVFQGTTLEAAVGELVACQERGQTRHIGVSNFPVALLERACAVGPVFANQVEYHPYLAQDEVLAACERLGVMLTAYCPLARGQVVRDPVLAEIGARHGKSAAQVALRWLLQQGISLVPKAASPGNRAANLAIFDFELSDAEMGRIAGLARPNGRLIDPPFVSGWD